MCLNLFLTSDYHVPLTVQEFYRRQKMDRIVRLHRKTSYTGSSSTKAGCGVPETKWYIEGSLDWVCNKVVQHLNLGTDKFKDDDVLELTISRVRYRPKDCERDL